MKGEKKKPGRAELKFSLYSGFDFPADVRSVFGDSYLHAGLY